MVPSGKGNEDRHTVLSTSLVGPLKLHVYSVEYQHQTDLAAGWGPLN